jgi:hypothetical protein
MGAEALKLPKGKSAMALRLAEQYLQQFGSIIKTAETSVLPDDLARLKSLVDTVTPTLSGGGPRIAGGAGSGPAGAGAAGVAGSGHGGAAGSPSAGAVGAQGGQA